MNSFAWSFPHRRDSAAKEVANQVFCHFVSAAFCPLLQNIGLVVENTFASTNLCVARWHANEKKSSWFWQFQTFVSKFLSHVSELELRSQQKLIKVVPNLESKQCYTPDQYPGQCVELSQCNNLFRLRHKAPQTIDDRVYVTLSQCGFESGKPLVCCASNAPYPLRSLAGANVRPPPVTQRPTFSPRPPVTSFGRRPQTFATRPPEIFTTRPPVDSRSSQCAGIVDNRIYGGREAQINEMPFTAVLGYSRSKISPCASETFWHNQFFSWCCR